MLSKEDKNDVARKMGRSIASKVSRATNDRYNAESWAQRNLGRSSGKTLALAKKAK